MSGKILTRDATLTVNDAEDGFLSSANDVAIVDVRDMHSITLYVNHATDDLGQPNGTPASLDLNTVGDTIDTVVEATEPGTAGENITVTFVADSDEDEGELAVAGTAVTFHFKDGVTTVSNFEDAVTALTGDDDIIGVATPGTGASTLDAAVKAELDLDPLAVNADTVLEAVTAGDDGNNITLTFVHSAGAPNAGSLTRVLTAFTFTYKGTVTTVQNFEDAVGALTGDDALIAVKTPGTGANVLADTDDEFGPSNFANGDSNDEFGPEPLAGGTDGEGEFDLVLETTIDGTNYAPLATLDETDFEEGSGLSVEIPLVNEYGMMKRVREVKITLTAIEDSSKFSMTAVGVEG